MGHVTDDHTGQPVEFSCQPQLGQIAVDPIGAFTRLFQ